MTSTGSRNENENDPVPGGRKSEEKSTKTEEDSVPGGRKTTTEKDSVHGGRKSLTRGPVKPYCETMVGLVGWWRRVELEASKEDKITRRLEQKKESKHNFLKKYYPNCTTSPGGRMKLLNKNS